MSFILSIFEWNAPLISLIFLKRSLVFPILLLPSISLHWSLRKAFLSLLTILWNSAFKWVYFSFSPLLFASLLFTVICKASSDRHFSFFAFPFLGDGLDLCLLYNVTCQEPPREIPPMTKVMRREPDRQRWIMAQGTPWICTSIYPKTRICLSYYFVPFTNSSDINRGLSPTTFLWKKST